MFKGKISIAHSSIGTGLLIVVAAAVTLVASSLIQYYMSVSSIRDEANRRAEGELESTGLEILDIVDLAEAAVRNNASLAGALMDYPSSLGDIPEVVLKNNPIVLGSSLAMVPGYLPEVTDRAPYAYRDDDGNILKLTLDTKDYDYLSQEWFTGGMTHERGYWSEPYFDEGGGEVLMTTFSMPVYDKRGVIAAVLTADISLEWLTQILGSIDVYPNAFSTILSREGKVMVSPVKALVMKASILDQRGLADKPEKYAEIAQAMLRGEKGHRVIKLRRNIMHVYYAPVLRTGWSMGIVVPEDDIFRKVKTNRNVAGLFQILGILLLIVILRSVSREQKRYAAVNETNKKMENDLQVARDIQMSMLPKVFPPFPERTDLDISASIVPAREVGGDLYDFYIRDRWLFFCVGDVSGKGVPAALVMAMTRSLFRTESTHELSMSRIVGAINESMMETNDSGMFVTFFCGRLNLETGHLRYCNAGHNAPVMLSSEISMLDVEANLPLGVLAGYQYKEQETYLSSDDALFLYTDGVTEAENPAFELFGEQRMIQVLKTRRSAAGNMVAMQKAVADFVGTADQSDDITMLFIHYTKARRLTLYNDISQISLLKGFIDELAGTADLDSSTAGSINLALEEAITNVILYAYPEGTRGEIHLEASEGAGKLIFTISDSGKPFDPTSAPEADVTLGVGERKIGGLGIFLVRQIMDSVSYEYSSGKNILTMTKNI